MRSPKKYLRAAMRVMTTNVRLGAGKLLHGSRLCFSPVTCLALSDSVELSPMAKIDFGKSLRTRGRCSFNVQESGELVFGKGVFLNQGCQFNCHSKIEIGDGCEFGPNVLVYDHDHAFGGEGGGLKEGPFKCSPVEIGEHCWIGAGTIILRGTKIGANSVVAAGSIVKGEFPSDSLILQRRTTEVRGC